jgi:hypothetical protein
MYRNDRKDGYGGVLIGVRLDIISTEYVNNKNIELVPVKVQLSKQKPLRDLPFNLKGRGGEEVMVFCFVQRGRGYLFFLKKYSDSNVAETNILILVEKKK